MIKAPAADRNKGPILSVLKEFIPTNVQLNALEIASGPGHHVSYFGQFFRNIIWQPTDIDDLYMNSIRGFCSHYKLENVKDPLILDVATPIEEWPICEKNFDLIFCINMMHIAPWRCAVGLFQAAGALLNSSESQGQGLLITYGPYAVDGHLTPATNVSFDRNLRAKDSEWGIRDVKDLANLAESNNMTLIQMHEMPANNKILVFKKNHKDNNS